ncbi:MAG: hypothetical protein QNJ05_09485 [Woeseiaceae bacterium]|nr:hypothetical protein [Woeseiaceae bacterium]
MAESEHESLDPDQPSHRSGGPLSWLIHPQRKRFLLPATGVWILVLDWLLFSSNLLSAWLATPVVVVLGFVLGSAGTFLTQRKAANDRPAMAALKALLAGIVVGVPWPLGGTIVGGWVLLTSGLADAKKEVMNRRD